MLRISTDTTKLATRQPDSYGNADDALYAASQLDSEGEWAKAISIYERAALLWPEHGNYCMECISQIKTKMPQ